MDIKLYIPQKIQISGDVRLIFKTNKLDDLWSPKGEKTFVKGMIKGITHAHLGPIWYYVFRTFRRFLQQDSSNVIIDLHCSFLRH